MPATPKTKPTNKQVQSAAKPTPTYNIENCTFTNTSASNKHTRAAIEALANAVKANAEAIGKIADALKGSPAHMEAAIRIGEGS